MKEQTVSTNIATILCIFTVLFFAIYNIATLHFYGIVLKQVELVENKEFTYISLKFNSSAKEIVKKTEIKKVNDGLGWIGENKHELKFLGENIIEVLIYDINVAKSLRDMDKHIVLGNLGYVSLNSNIKYMITYPPDDALTAVYIGSNNTINKDLIVKAKHKDLIIELD